jgi:hypothetical protein
VPKLVSLCLETTAQIPAFSSAVLAAIFAKTKRRAGLFLQAGEPTFSNNLRICKVHSGQGSLQSVDNCVLYNY